jgi:hypothetical protein
MIKETLLEVLRTQALPPSVAGEVARGKAADLAPLPGMATVLTGGRRCGKSTLQAQLARRVEGRLNYLKLESNISSFFINWKNVLPV